MKKQPERTAATRSAFVDAFINISESRPIEKITIQEIADKAGCETYWRYSSRRRHVAGRVCTISKAYYRGNGQRDYITIKSHLC